jgi:glycosyltransferase involved in cell wall biosynthesis
MPIRIDEPTAGQRVRGTLRVRGWAHLEGGVARVQIRLGPHRFDARIGRHRPAVGIALDDATAVFAGYEAEIDLAAIGASGPVDVTVEAYDMDSRPLLSHTVEIEVEHAVVRPGARFRPRPRVRRRRRSEFPVRLLIAARSLDQGGSQLRMAELAESMVRDPRFDVAVLSPVDGPLRARLETAGVPVHVRPGVPYDDPGGYAAGVAELAAWMRGRLDVVLVFTMTGIDVLHAAETLGVPRVLRVGEHEPLATVARWVGRAIHPEVEARALRTIAASSAVVFLSQVGRRVHRAYGLRGRAVVLPSGIDTRRPESFALTRAQARTQLGLPPEARIAMLSTSLWPIKGQAVLVRSFAAVTARCPDLCLVMMGDGPESYIDAVRTYADTLGLSDRITILPFTDDLDPWWRAADLVAFSSETEAAPAVVLEAGAWGLPVVATRVGNVEEVVEDGVSGWLCRPSDAADLARALEAAASASDATLERMGAALRERVRRDHDHTTNVDQLARLLLTLTAGPRSGLA